MKIRIAHLDEGPILSALVEAAYTLYIPRIGAKPGPMLEDYADLCARGLASVLEQDGVVMGLLVLIDCTDHLLLDNIAIAPQAQGQGFGRILVTFAEEEAIRRGFSEIRLYTHIKMTENIALYPRLGYTKTHRARQAGFDRVFFTKKLGSRI
jgi:ribosomal protein S18 acetylase RimI-like enzyme